MRSGTTVLPFSSCTAGGTIVYYRVSTISVIVEQGRKFIMAVEVSYILITPYSLLKSRTGGIIARLMSRTDLEFIGAQVLSFTREMAARYAESLRHAASHISPQSGELLADYV